MSQTIAFTQPYVPTYRVPLFNELSRLLRSDGRELIVFSGQPHGEQASRGDSSSGEWHRPLKASALGVGRWTLETRDLPSALKGADLLVSELSALNDIAWRRSFSKQPLVLWGHGKSYVNDANWLSDRVEWSLARRAEHVMTYAEGGRRYMVERGGFDPSRVTAIGNSTDTVRLRAAYADLMSAVMASTINRSTRTALFVGALDSTKRLDFVLEAFEVATRLDPNVNLVVAGEGRMSGIVDSLARRDARVRRVGDVRGEDLARIAVGADAIWMPGRVGLVAVDALALGLPIHTTNYPYHAPEVEFLSAGEIEYLPDEPSAFASASLAAMSLGRPPIRQDIPTIQSVAANMAEVIDEVLAA